MSQSKKPKPTAVPAEDVPVTLKEARTAMKRFDPRNGLGIYIDKPEDNPEGRVVEYDDDFVVINDKYPKARYAVQVTCPKNTLRLTFLSVHLLLIPRDPKYYNQHPLSALSTDAAFLDIVRTRVERLRNLAASELRRQYGHLSVSDAPYQEALEAAMSVPDLSVAGGPNLEREDMLNSLPPGRDWAADIFAGVHTHPSMNHLHIHVFSRDMQSPWMKHKKHYLSFNSTFLVQLDEFPLHEGSERPHPGNWPSWSMKCWRCGRDFKNKFAALKTHLADEFEVWKRE
jgi:aprataxin